MFRDQIMAGLASHSSFTPPTFYIFSAFGIIICHGEEEKRTMTKSSTTAAAFRAIAQARRSSRRFQPNRSIPPPILKDILNSTLKSPSGFNMQPTQVLLVRDAELKSQLANSAMLGPGNIFRTNDASALAVFLADLEPTKRFSRIQELESKAGVRDPNYMTSLPIATTFLLGQGHAATFAKQVATDLMSPMKAAPSIESVDIWSVKNTALLAQTFVYAATSHGLATCMMEGYDIRRVKEILRVPDRYAVPLMCCVGYEYENLEEVKRTPRLGMEEVVFGDTFGELLDLYEEEDEEKEDVI